MLGDQPCVNKSRGVQYRCVSGQTIFHPFYNRRCWPPSLDPLCRIRTGLLCFLTFIHSGLHEIKFTEVLSHCPSPSGLIINTFLLSFDEFCTATEICGSSVLTTPSPTDSCASTTHTCLLRTPHSHVRTYHKKTKDFSKITNTDIFKFTIPGFLIWTDLKVAVMKRTSPQNFNNPGVLVAPVWLSHVCLTGFGVLWERLVSVWWLGIDWRHFHLADRIG